VLILVAVTYAVLQVLEYFDTLKLDDVKKQRASFWFMVITIVVALTIICVSIFALAGKLF
jgi:heme/copper-type cytochrome/quinol oxidase subunit 4